MGVVVDEVNDILEGARYWRTRAANLRRRHDEAIAEAIRTLASELEKLPPPTDPPTDGD